MTTTSETFEVYMTVGFFEVLNSGPYYATTGPANTWVTPQLGKEVFKDVPGDLRTRFYAVIDRSNLAIDPTSIVPGSTPKQGKKPAITELASTLPPSTIAGNVQIDIQATGFVGGTAGTPATTINNPAALTLQYDMSPTETTPFVITAGTVLRIGYGAAEELVTVNAVNAFDTLTGTGRLTVVRAVSPNTHAIGTRVMNGDTSLGNPGPQPAFDPSQPNYQAVMPYMQKLDD